jgi:hypothetical protein
MGSRNIEAHICGNEMSSAQISILSKSRPTPTRWNNFHLSAFRPSQEKQMEFLKQKAARDRRASGPKCATHLRPMSWAAHAAQDMGQSLRRRDPTTLAITPDASHIAGCSYFAPNSESCQCAPKRKTCVLIRRATIEQAARDRRANNPLDFCCSAPPTV